MTDVVIELAAGRASEEATGRQQPASTDNSGARTLANHLELVL